MSVKFPCWRADRVILLALTPEHDLPMLNRHTSLGFLNEDEEPVLGLTADLCSRDFEFIHLKDAYSFGIYYPPPSPRGKRDQQVIFTFVFFVT